MNPRRIIGCGIAVIAAFTLALATTACGGDDDDGGNGGGGSGPTFLGSTLELSGQVYEQEVTETGVSYKAFNGSLPNLTSSGEGSGAITNGQLTYTIGTPTGTLYPINDFIEDVGEVLLYGGKWSNIQPASSNVMCFLVDGLVSSSNYVLRNNRILTFNPETDGDEWVLYLYVDGDITISGTGKTETITDPLDGFTYTDILNNFSLALKQGWNTFYLKKVESRTTYTISMSLSNPNSLKWILGSSSSSSSSVLPPPQGQRSLSDAPTAGNSRFKAFDRIWQR